MQAYAVSMTSQAGENLLLVVGSSATVSAVDASTVKIGDKTTENLRWAGSCGQIVAVNGDAKVVVSGLGDKLGTTGWRPAKPEEAYKFPLQLLKPVLSGKTLKLPELDNIPAQ